MNRTIIACLSIVGVLLVTSTQATSSTEIPLVELTTYADYTTEPSIPGNDLLEKIQKFLAKVISSLKEKFTKCALIADSAKDLFRHSLILLNSLVYLTKQVINEIRDHCLSMQFFSCSKEQIRLAYDHSPVNSDYWYFEASILKFLLSLGNCGKIVL